MRKPPKLFSVFVVAVLLSLGSEVALAAGPIVLDGRPDDWAGRERLEDKSGDGSSGADIRYFYWGTNDNDSRLYFMLDRYSAGDGEKQGAGKSAEDPSSKAKKVEYRIYIDTNNDGRYDSDVDRVVAIEYNPNENTSNTRFEISTPGGRKIAHYAGNWGQSIQEGAFKVEAGAGFADLGIVSRQTIRMYVVAENQDRVPDSGDIQFSPIPILDYPLLTLLVVGTILFVWWKKGRLAWRSS